MRAMMLRVLMVDVASEFLVLEFAGVWLIITNLD